tara:strand:+ start:71 stop:322 length:252 start_codon:yes stop_codon:yes gene_type:complete
MKKKLNKELHLQLLSVVGKFSDRLSDDELITSLLIFSNVTALELSKSEKQAVLYIQEAMYWMLQADLDEEDFIMRKQQINTIN